jgi:hypothetical protein
MLKRNIADLSEAPEGTEGFYTQNDDGSFDLQVDGPGATDVTKLKTALANERAAHKGTKGQFTGIDVTAAELQELRDAKEDLAFQLESAPKAQSPEELEDRAEIIAARKTRELDRELQQLRADNANYMDAIGQHEAAQTQRSLRDAALDAISGDKGVKIVESAREDLLPFVERSFEMNDMGEIVSRDGIGIEPGLTIRETLTEMASSGRRSHWFEQSQGAGAQGAKGGNAASANNPFKTGNLTEIAQLIKNDRSRATAMAKAAGVENPAKYGL